MNLATPQEVDAAYAMLERVDGVELLEEPQDMPWGGRGFSFRGSEGTRIDERGGLTFP